MTSPAVVDCRSLIEFCKAYAENQSPPPSHQRRSNHCGPRKHCVDDSPNSFLAHYPFFFCSSSHSPSVAVDAVVLLLVIGALGTLTVPCFKFVFHGLSEVLVPSVGLIVRGADMGALLPYAVCSVAAAVVLVVLWELVGQQSRKCGKPYCKGLRKAVEFDIQLESEECVKCMPPLPKVLGVQPLELEEQDLKALEAELKRMAPSNGRTVLIFRKPCGCPVGRLEVWGPKKVRRVKK